MDIPILFEDDAMIAVNKPPGIVVNNAESVKGETVQDWMAVRTPFDVSQRTDETKDFYDRAGIVHRIDKETSGILLIAKTIPAFVELQRQFKERVIHKIYVAIVHGALVPEQGEVRAPVGRLPWNREHFGIVPGGKESVTKYKVVRQFERMKGKQPEKYSLVELYPETGRTHQIRVHLKYINHPIVGDYLYAGRKTARDDRVWAPRVMLHAWKLSCIHPITHETLAIEAPIPDDMNTIIHGRA
jgi:23S rRNA pseudouridine1911/1915/1917 synthase